MSNPRQIISLLFVGVAIGVSLGLVSNYLNSFKVIYVKNLQGLQINVYKDRGAGAGNKVYNFDPNKSLFSMRSSQSVKLKKGVYDFVVNDPVHQYDNTTTKLVVGKFTDSVTIDPGYNAQKLSELLQTEGPKARQALISSYPATPGTYTLTSEALYGHGEWYGAKLSPQATYLDTLYVIMHKSNGVWSVAARPQLSIGIPSNPSIPGDVIENVDQL